ncbi:MAG: O-antigen ligase family protein [Anaerolineales bacterium]|nr:O-antigen ligase family protein [Anaerolineales bacterium]
MTPEPTDASNRQRSDLVDYLRLLTQLAFGGMIVFIPFRYRTIVVARPHPPIYGDFTNFLLFASDFFLLATLLFWGLGFLFKRRRLKTGPFFLTYPLLAVLLVSGISIIFSVDQGLSTYHFIRFLGLAGLYLYVVNEVQGLRDIAVPILLQTIIQAWVGIAQTLAQHSIGWYSLGELELDPAWSGVGVVMTATTRALRAYGLSDHPNILGGCLALALLVLAGWYLEREQDDDQRWQPVRAVLLLPGLACLLLTFSRAAWLGVFGGLIWVVAVLIQTRQFRIVGTLAALAGAWVLAMSPFIWQNLPYLSTRINPPTQETGGHEIVIDTSLVERRVLGEAANNLFAENAIWGTGLGTFPVALQAAYPKFPLDYQPVHNVLLDVASEIGLFGSLFYFLVMLAPWLALWINRKRLVFTPTLVATSAALLAASVIGLFDYYFWYLIPGRYWQVLAWGLWAVSFQNALNHE